MRANVNVNVNDNDNECSMFTRDLHGYTIHNVNVNNQRQVS